MGIGTDLSYMYTDIPIIDSLVSDSILGSLINQSASDFIYCLLTSDSAYDLN